MNTTDVENFPGFPEGILGPDLMDNMQDQAERFGAEVIFDDATELELDGEVKVIRTGNGEEYRAYSVILAMGSAYRELGLPDEGRLTGRGVSWCATCDGFFFKEQDIRSEEHTSELQSRGHLVCRLLLEKKKYT